MVLIARFYCNLILSGLMLSLVCSAGVIVSVGLIIVFVVLRLAWCPPAWKMAVHMAAADDVFCLANFMLSFPTESLGWDP